MQYLIHDKPVFLEYTWQYQDTHIKGWLCIHNLKNEIALATFIATNKASKANIKVLAAQNQIRHSQSGPVMGGAALGINIDQTHPDFSLILNKWFADIQLFLKESIGFTYTENTNLNRSIKNALFNNNIDHPLSSLLHNEIKEDATKICSQIDEWDNIVLKNKELLPINIHSMSVNQIINGWSTAVSIKHYFDKYSALMFKRFAVVNGWNKTTQFTAYYLAKYGVKINAIFNNNKAIVNKDGFGVDEISEMIVDDGFLNDNEWISLESAMHKIKKIPIDIAIDSIDNQRFKKEYWDILLASGLEVMAQYYIQESDFINLISSPLEQYLDAQISVLPIHISCMGKDRLKAIILEGKLTLDGSNIFQDLYKVTEQSITRLNQVTPKQKYLLRKAVEMGSR